LPLFSQLFPGCTYNRLSQLQRITDFLIGDFRIIPRITGIDRPDRQLSQIRELLLEIPSFGDEIA